MPKRNRSRLFGAVILCGLICPACSLTSAAPRIAPELADLLNKYRALGLPVPPQGAKLVLHEMGAGIGRRRTPRFYTLAFEVKPGPQTQVVTPEPEAFKKIILGKDVLLDSESELFLAIQSHALGWHKLATYLLQRSQEEAESRGLAAPESRERLLELAWGYWTDKITQPNIDRAPVAKRLKEMMRQYSELDNPLNQELVKSLELTLVPSKAKPGSIEALIDDLVDYDADVSHLKPFEEDERCLRIAKLGFDAVPALIQHLDDNRFTRAWMPGFNNFPSFRIRVRHLASWLLEGLAGHTIGEQRLYGRPVEKAEAQKWWDDARKMGEETYLLDSAFLLHTDLCWLPFVSGQRLLVIQTKYPQHIPSLYRRLLDKRPDLDSRLLADAVLHCKLTDKEKMDLLLYGTKHKDLDQRLTAIAAIGKLDKKQYDSLLLAVIESIPKDVPGSYWGCPEGRIPWLVLASDDTRVWQALEKAARRATVGLRMHLLDMPFPEDQGHRLERFNLLARFLNDGDLRVQDAAGKNGVTAPLEYDKIEVRNFVALQIADLLGIDIETNPERTPQEWAKIRSQVQHALVRELGKTR